MLRQIGVEGRGDKANERTPFFRHHDLPAMTAHDPGRGEGVDGVQFRREFRRAGLGIEIDRKIAHQPLDDPGALEIVGREREALGDGKPPTIDRAQVRADIRRILHIALRQPPDRGSAEADQGVARVGGIALEIAMQATGACGAQQASWTRAK